MQSAYRANYSTETALVRVCNDINMALDIYKEVILVLLDLSSAFDMIDHEILITRLADRFGIRGTVLRWIKSYLYNRTQSIVIGDVQSVISPIDCGVPQSSVLGPMLFSLYISPIEGIIQSHGLQFMLYADDIQMYITFEKSDSSIAMDKLSYCAQDVMSWMVNNKLVCNASKTEVVHFSSRFLLRNPISEITLNGDVIESSPAARDLGVSLDHYLKMSTRVNDLCRTAILALKRISRIRRYLNSACCEQLVHAFVSSRLDYSNSLLIGLPDKEISKIQRIQNSAARLVTKTKKRDHITPVLRKLHWLTIDKRIVFKVLIITYKALHGLSPKYISDWLTLKRSSRILRSNYQDSLKLETPTFKTKNYGGKAFSVCAPRLWNDLPRDLRNSPSLETFKRGLKTYLFNQ